MYVCVPSHTNTHTHTHTGNSSCGTLHNSICVINWQLTEAAIKISGHKIQLWPQQVHKQNTHAHTHTKAHARTHKIDTYSTNTHIQPSLSLLLTPCSIRNQCNQLCMHPCGRHAALRCTRSLPPLSYSKHSPKWLAGLPTHTHAHAHVLLSHTHTLTAANGEGLCKATVEFSNIFGYFLTFLTSAQHLHRRD